MFEILKMQNGFSRTDKEIANYILENTDSFLESTIKEISSEVYCSPGTISKFVDRYFKESFSTFKTKLAYDYAIKKTVDMAGNSTVADLEKNPERTYSYLLQTYSSVLSYTSAHIDHNMLNDFTKDIIENREDVRILVFAEGLNYIYALEFQKLCERIGIDCLALEPFMDGIVEASNINKNRRVILISHSGTNKKVLKIAQLVKDNGANPLVLTRSKTSQLAEMFDLVQIVASSKSDFTELSTFHFTTSIQFVLRSVFSLLYSGDYMTNESRIRKSSSALDYD